MSRTARLAFAVASLALLAAPSASEAITTYTGSLTTAGGGLTGTAQWGTGPTTLSWTHTQAVANGPWHYHYDLTLPSKDISHALFEISDEVLITSVETPLFSGGAWPVGLDDEGPSDPGNDSPFIPGDIHALKFDELTGTTVSFDWDLDVGPTWGDFYAKDGKEGGPGGGDAVAIWNTGFVAGEALGLGLGNDPIGTPPSSTLPDASPGFHVLIPDTDLETGGLPPDPMLPEPLTLVAVGAGLVPLARYARRRTGRS